MLHFIKKTLTFALTVTISLTLLTGCGKEDESLKQYKENMTSFCESIIEKNDTINSIDASSETAIQDLLENLDDLNTNFNALAEMEVPSEFSSVETLADEAGTYMNQAVSLYHQVFEAEEFDQSTLDVANENYNRAIKRVQYIGDILMGQIPDGEDVTVIHEDDSSEEEATDTVG